MNHAESVLYTHLTSPDSLDVLARENFSSAVVREVIPTELGRELVAWSLDYFFENGREVAPSRLAILETWGDRLEQVDISLGDDTETDSIQWAIEQLRNHYAAWHAQDFTKRFVTSVAQADPYAKVAAIQEGAFELYRISQALSSSRKESTLHQGLVDSLAAYEKRAATGLITQGLTFGLPLIDEHIHGIHDGEIAIFGAGSGTGKSWVAVRTFLAEWKAGRRAVLYTLENSLAMTFDRIACAQAGMSYDKWQRGCANDGDLLRFRETLDQVKASDLSPMVIMPEEGERTMVSMVRQAATLGAQSIIIDQLTHVRSTNGHHRARWEATGDKMHELNELINSPSTRMSALLIHQMNREGIKSARTSGRFVMDNLSDGSEVERTAAFVFSAYQSRTQKETQQAIWQMLKGRRVSCKDWLMRWNLEFGRISVIGEVTDDEE